MVTVEAQDVMVRVVVVKMVEVVISVVDSVLEDETGAVEPVVLGVVTG